MNDPTIQTEKLEQDLEEHEYYADPQGFSYTFILIALLILFLLFLGQKILRLNFLLIACAF